MAEQIKLDWLIIMLVRCTSPTHKHKTHGWSHTSEPSVQYLYF